MGYVMEYQRVRAQREYRMADSMQSVCGKVPACASDPLHDENWEDTLF